MSAICWTLTQIGLVLQQILRNAADHRMSSAKLTFRKGLGLKAGKLAITGDSAHDPRTG